MRVSTRLLSLFGIHFSFPFPVPSPDTQALVDQAYPGRYSSVVKSEPLALCVRITLRIEGRLAPVTPSISFWVSGRAPLRMSTRLLLFDMSFLLFSLAFSQSGQAQPAEKAFGWQVSWGATSPCRYRGCASCWSRSSWRG